jgi:hypothetical protein
MTSVGTAIDTKETTMNTTTSTNGRRYQPNPTPCRYCGEPKKSGEFTIDLGGNVSCWDCYYDTDWRNNRAVVK